MKPESAAVLIVEDESVVLKVAGMALAAHGLSFRQATDVSSAAAVLDSHSIRVVLTDLKLPGDSGLEILTRARKLSPPPEVVVITGYATIENNLQSFQRGAFDFVPKPFDVDELISVVDRALRFVNRPREDDAILATDRYSLGRHSWARLDADGSATLGVAETVAGVMGDLTRVESLEVGNHVAQGQSYCRLTAEKGLTHTIWAPLSGRVIMHNAAVVEDPNLINRDPFATGWIARIIPSHPEEELPNLRQPQGPEPGP